MSGMFGKLAPIATVFGLTVWCCWPYLEGAPEGTGLQQGGDLPRISGALLSPTVQPAPERNPFQPPLVSKATPPETEEPSAQSAVGTQSSVGTPAPEQQEAVVEEESPDIFSGLVLGAIYIQGNRRVALINGQVCEQGDRLAISASSADPCIVTEISADKVLLSHGGQTVELKYAGR